LEPKFYCKHTGESAYLGPGTYNDHDVFKKLNKQPCSALMKKIGMLEPEESKKQCYIMVGQSIKYEPAWVVGRQKFTEGDHQGFLEKTNVKDCRKSVS
jgi:hypothetical protein